MGGGGGGGGAVERDPKHADIEREVREQQGGGVRTDGSGGVESGGGLQRKESMAVSQARELLLQGLISSEELEAVVQKDQVKGWRVGACCVGARCVQAIASRRAWCGFPLSPALSLVHAGEGLVFRLR